MIGLNKILATIALTAIVLAFTAPALAQGMPMASPTMTPTMKPEMQGDMKGVMPMQMTKSDKDISSAIMDMGDTSIMMAMMKTADLGSMLAGGKQYTMFVPNDMAMQKIGMDKMNMMMKDKQMAMNMMKGLTTDSMVMPSDMTDGKTLTMMNGQTMTVKTTGGQTMIDGAGIKKATQASNGMIYMIDSIPSSLMNTMQIGSGPMGMAPANI